MRSNDVIYFLTPEYTVDSLGQKIPTGEYIDRMVFANELSVGMNEFYSASVAGFKPEKQFEFYAIERGGETLVRHEDEIYTVIRSQKKGEKMRITCEKDVGQ